MRAPRRSFRLAVPVSDPAALAAWADELVRHFGGVDRAAAQLGLSRVVLWRIRNRRLLELQARTVAALLAGAPSELARRAPALLGAAPSLGATWRALWEDVRQPGASDVAQLERAVRSGDFERLPTGVLFRLEGAALRRFLRTYPDAAGRRAFSIPDLADDPPAGDDAGLRAWAAGVQRLWRAHSDSGRPVLTFARVDEDLGFLRLTRTRKSSPPKGAAHK